MPVDHKRIRGPDDSLPYYLYSKTYNKSKNLQITRSNEREDRRSHLEHRKICEYHFQLIDHKTT